MTNFKRCWLAASHYETLANGTDYFCDHHAQMRKKQGGALEPLKAPNEKIRRGDETALIKIEKGTEL